MQCISCECLFSETRFPLILSCGHTVCCECAEKIQKEGLPCPNCAPESNKSLPPTAAPTLSSPSPPIDLSGKNIIDASKDGELEVVRAFLDRGDDINQKDEVRGLTSLHDASVYGHLPIVSLLLDAGANIEEKDEYGFTPLHFASHNGHPSIVSYLLDKGANIEEKTKGGKTPLHIATNASQQAIVSLLLDRGANINEKDNVEQITPLYSRYSHQYL